MNNPFLSAVKLLIFKIDLFRWSYFTETEAFSSCTTSLATAYMLSDGGPVQVMTSVLFSIGHAMLTADPRCE